MYEVPTLSTVGKVEEVVRGVVSTGNDDDGMYYVPDMEFLSDSQFE